MADGDGKLVQRKIIRIDESLCNGCGSCIIACSEGAIKLADGKARVVSDAFCDGLGACIGECPTGALTIEVREAQPFDEEAARANLSGFCLGSVSGFACYRHFRLSDTRLEILAAAIKPRNDNDGDKTQVTTLIVTNSDTSNDGDFRRKNVSNEM